MPEIKICGICNLEDAQKAVSLGANYLGFIFAESPRQISTADARLIKRKLADQVKLVGVFKDQDSRLVNDTAEVLNFDFVQLHGAESPEYCLEMNRPVIKAIELDPAQEFVNLHNYSSAVQAFLFDRPKTMLQKDSWLDQIIAKFSDEMQRCQPFFIAGGLNETNVLEALKLKPFGIDLASSVELEPGKKDHGKLESFFSVLQGAR